MSRNQASIDIGDAYVEAFGPCRVLHTEGEEDPHIDVYIWKPIKSAPSWLLMTGGRSLRPIEGQRFELVVWLRPTTTQAEAEEMAEVLRRVAHHGAPLPGWTFKGLEDDAAFVRLGKSLPDSPKILKAVYRRPG